MVDITKVPGFLETVNAASVRRASVLAGGADLKCRFEPLSLEEFRAYCIEVWRDEGQHQHLGIEAFENLPRALQLDYYGEDLSAMAEWKAHPYSGIPHAWIVVQSEGLFRNVALHEVAHLLVDTEEQHLGHGALWASTYIRLMTSHLRPERLDQWAQALDETCEEVYARYGHEAPSGDGQSS